MMLIAPTVEQERAKPSVGNRPTPIILPICVKHQEHGPSNLLSELHIPRAVLESEPTSLNTRHIKLSRSDSLAVCIILDKDEVLNRKRSSPATEDAEAESS